MADTKTQALARPFADWAASDVPEPRRAETLALDALFREATGFVPQVWTGGIVGYGAYDYTYASGRTGTWMATGFATRKARMSVYIMPGYTDFRPFLERLGQHSTGKRCLYIWRLARIVTEVLAELVRAGLADLRATWPVRPAA